ncbi:MAG: hypothetical protein Q7T55_12765, partial [Solirubrobacteraceae bacterium]|nr:hypothetical protein [Solirubrobacteraceae bacterium]
GAVRGCVALTDAAADLGKRLQLEIKAIAKDPNQNRVTTVFSETTAVITDPPPPAPDEVLINGGGGGPVPNPTSSPVPTPAPTPGPKGLVIEVSVPKKVKAGVEIKAPKSVAGYRKVTYQWLRNGKKIKKATKRVYRLTKADRNKKISCRMTLTPAAGGAKVVITTTPVKVPKK